MDSEEAVAQRRWGKSMINIEDNINEKNLEENNGNEKKNNETLKQQQEHLKQQNQQMEIQPRDAQPQKSW